MSNDAAARAVWLAAAAAWLPTAAPGAGLADPIPEPIAKSATAVNLVPVAGGLGAPNLLTHAGDGSGRLFIVDQPGRVRLADGGLRPDPFLDVSDLLVAPSPNADERGLLGLAFHPGFAVAGSSGEGKLYTYTSEPVGAGADFTAPGASPQHQSVIREWRVDPSDPEHVDRTLPGSGRELLRIDQPQANHNGGMIEFGSDGMLHIALGDGGGSNDAGTGHGPDGNGQRPQTVLGSILRIDVDGSDSANGQYGIPSDNPFVGNAEGIPEETFAFGFRNPFRFSFDGDDLIAADVGQGNIEEVDVVSAGANHGWRLKEGSFAFDPADGSVSADLSGLPPGLVDPALEYDHDEGVAVIGGYVYRGTDVPELSGKYVFGDFSGRLLAGDLATGSIEELVIGANDDPLGLFVLGFGRDADGELYLLGSAAPGPDALGMFGDSGVALRLAPLPVPGALWLLAGALAGLLVGRGRWLPRLCASFPLRRGQPPSLIAQCTRRRRGTPLR